MTDDGYRAHLVEALHAASRDYDQAILALGAGTLALSVTFVHEVTPNPAANTPIVLIAAWFSLAASLVAILLSFLASQRDLRDLIDAVDRGEENVGGDPNRRAAAITQALNGIAGGGLIAGLVVLGWYALANI